MARQLHELLDRFSDMSDDEALEKIREIRRRKYEEKPAVKQRQQKQTKKTANKAKSRIENLMSGMSEEQKARLLKELEDGDQN